MNVRSEFAEAVEYCEDAYEAARGASALCVMTEWQEYRTPDPERLVELMEPPRVIVDGRNLYRDHALEERGLTVLGIGYSLEP